VKRFRLADFTADRELHPALKIFLLCCGKLSLGSHEHPPVALSSFFRLQSYKKKCIFHYLLQKNRGKGNKKDDIRACGGATVHYYMMLFSGQSKVVRLNIVSPVILFWKCVSKTCVIAFKMICVFVFCVS